ncbi:hypothetical protein ELI02_02105 [Rhizobium leguminosarum]|uniref:hypothetical protein n=1 Tax=Rhizobium leguminosarum TaxID=384 RepID=UPI00102F6D8F|nr:hypothetical protein [Rhizobium leguminosarum]TAX58913.1 hypothetical protein ELI02_02105 [Rhizobium leguminosarum]
MNPDDLAAMARVATDYSVQIEHESEGTIIRIQPASPTNGFQPGRGGADVTRDPFEPIWPPLDYREAFTLKTLVEIGVGQIAYSSLIRWCDRETVRKLAARGYIVAKPPGRKISDDEIRLTDEGVIALSAAMKRLNADYVATTI